jgi:hypothetical protein
MAPELSDQQIHAELKNCKCMQQSRQPALGGPAGLVL